MTKKAKLRQALKKKRLEMTDAERTLKSREIVRRLTNAIDWSGVKTVHYFEPLHELMEVDISGLVVELEDNYPDIQLFAPKLIGGEWEMISIKDKPASDGFDIIIVPMLGFDDQLHRIGYGGGYYDKFLATQPLAKKIGVCFEAGKVEHIPAEPHDVQLDLLVTEQQVYRS